METLLLGGRRQEWRHRRRPRLRKRLIYLSPADIAVRYRARFGPCRRHGHTPFWYGELGIFCYRCHRRVAVTGRTFEYR